MRIIAGGNRGTNLFTLDGEKTRPTSGRVREALFSMLGERVLGAKVLDLFAGSGALGLEALSRGADRVDFVDNNGAAIEIINKNVLKMRCENSCQIFQTDYIKFLKRTESFGTGYDIVFLDPPYASGYLVDAAEVIVQKDMMKKDGVIVCECAASEDIEINSLKQIKNVKYGKSKIIILAFAGRSDNI